MKDAEKNTEPEKEVISYPEQIDFDVSSITAQKERLQAYLQNLEGLADGKANHNV